MRSPLPILFGLGLVLAVSGPDPARADARSAARSIDRALKSRHVDAAMQLYEAQKDEIHADADAALITARAFVDFGGCREVMRYQQIPDIYFNELQQGYAEAGKANDGPGGIPPRFMGRDNEVTKRALEKAFEGIDLEKLHKDFTQGIKRGM